ncbi:hypothetical protein F383_20093 [Gossypium arboreum]|uniref:Uncharacterized protein n=1 Tax=Gossypium arboreum TaxID=29729 RepID=A0A0B0NFL6_GOSAR|nr:hypothetical protein F383_20093 [Gossypium arboreum]
MAYALSATFQINMYNCGIST